MDRFCNILYKGRSDHGRCLGTSPDHGPSKGLPRALAQAMFSQCDMPCYGFDSGFFPHYGMGRGRGRDGDGYTSADGDEKRRLPALKIIQQISQNFGNTNSISVLTHLAAKPPLHPYQT